jgi:signal transduction histidine kinase
VKFFRSLFKGLRGRLTLTYTLVTVLALMALEAILFISATAYSQVTDTENYLNDVVTTLVPEARSYLQPEQDLPGLQVWLTTLSRKGYASLEPQGLFDSPAAAIVKNSPIHVLSPDGEILAWNESAEGGKFIPYSELVIENAYSGNQSIRNLYEMDGNGNYWVAVPIYQKDHTEPVLGVITLTVEPLPVKNLTYWSSLLGLGMLAGALLLVALAPFGAVFGYILSKGLTRRLSNLSTTAQAWGKGDFTMMPPPDRGNDEISALSYQMREMASKIGNLMQDKQALAQMKERNRIAQELHDTVKQQSFATLMQVRAARNLLPTDSAAAEKSLCEAETLIKASQQELALMISELRPPALEGKGLVDALRSYVESWSTSACVLVTCKIIGNRDLPFDVEHTLYRVAQEGLSNVARHSRASAVIVNLVFEENQVVLIIEDNGAGFDFAEKQASGFGLISMQDRLKEVGGKLEIRTGIHSGTQLTASVPLLGKILTNGDAKNV